LQLNSCPIESGPTRCISIGNVYAQTMEKYGVYWDCTAVRNMCRLRGKAHGAHQNQISSIALEFLDLQ